jgi:polyketide biosynthesis acyl carrier protein
VIPHLQRTELTTDNKLEDLGANIIECAEIIDRTVDLLSLNMERVDLYGNKNLGGLADAIYERLR